MSKHIYSVTRLVGEIRSLLEDSYHEIWVEGEISGLATPASGHRYFSLKDDTTLIRCVLFSNRQQQFSTVPAEGMQILVRGRISMYESRGDLQLLVSYLEDAGEGALRREFELLKRKLATAGMFDKQHKQPLPTYPQTIGIISSQRGAALYDICSTLQRRYPIARLIVYPTLVQGTEAVDSIINMLKIANQRYETDLLILARGGGSAEDLQAFNHERVAHAIFASKLPIVSAIGHETDFTIADLVGDVRAATPTAAAEVVSPECVQLSETIRVQSTTLHKIAQRGVDARQQTLDYTSARLGHPLSQIQWARQSHQALTNQLIYLVKSSLDKWRLQRQQQTAELRYRSPQARIAQNLQNLRALHHQLHTAATARFTIVTQTIQRLADKLRVMSPTHTLDRGYAIIQDQNHQVILDAGKTNKGQTLTARVARGQFQCVVERVLEE